jgi:hypothetical protein
MQEAPALVSLLMASPGCCYLVSAAGGEMALSPEAMKRRWREGVEFLHFDRGRREVAR